MFIYETFTQCFVGIFLGNKYHKSHVNLPFHFITPCHLQLLLFNQSKIVQLILLILRGYVTVRGSLEFGINFSSWSFVIHVNLPHP